MIFGKAVIRRNCVRTDKKEADNEIATIKRLCTSDKFAGAMFDLPFFKKIHMYSYLKIMEQFFQFNKERTKLE
jgi:5,10-methylene-tetrahydrofolate dehydrogenase/methenyl tetrahydrofolate cyclohydrolase